MSEELQPVKVADKLVEPVKPDRRTRSATLEDIELLANIHQRSRELFRGTAHEHVLDRPTLSLEYLRKAQENGLLWVALDDIESVVGFAAAEVIADRVHLEQLSVAPEFGNNGLGHELVDNVKLWARENGYPGVTLVTYSDIPWNKPYYEKRGFIVRPTQGLSPEQQQVMVEDAEAGFDPGQRVFMEALV